jgi:hypothetical protein
MSAEWQERGGDWWCLPVIPALRRLRLEDCEVQSSLGYIVKPCLKTPKKTKQNQTQKLTARRELHNV